VTPRAIAVLVHWGDQEPTLTMATACLESGAFHRVVVIANDLIPLKAATPRAPAESQVSWVIPERNLGYGAACQLATRLHDADYYAFLNTDVELLGRAAEACLAALHDGGLDIAGPVLVHHDGRLQSGCGTWSRLLQTPLIRRSPQAPISACGWITGAAMFCRREVMAEVGFDGSYFLGLEDADLCDRARERGWTVGVVRDARGIHEGGATMTEGRWQYHSLRNRVWFARKRRSTPVAVANVIWLAVALVPRVVFADTVKRRGYQLTRSAWRALIDARATLPPFGEPWPHEPVPQAWMHW